VNDKSSDSATEKPGHHKKPEHQDFSTDPKRLHPHGSLAPESKWCGLSPRQLGGVARGHSSLPR
jgi:hypothetical protein